MKIDLLFQCVSKMFLSHYNDLRLVGVSLGLSTVPSVELVTAGDMFSFLSSWWRCTQWETFCWFTEETAVGQEVFRSSKVKVATQHWKYSVRNAAFLNHIVYFIIIICITYVLNRRKLDLFQFLEDVYYGGPEVQNTTANQKPQTQIRKHNRFLICIHSFSFVSWFFILCSWFLICVCVFWFAVVFCTSGPPYISPLLHF